MAGKGQTRLWNERMNVSFFFFLVFVGGEREPRLLRFSSRGNCDWKSRSITVQEKETTLPHTHTSSFDHLVNFVCKALYGHVLLIVLNWKEVRPGQGKRSGRWMMDGKKVPRKRAWRPLHLIIYDLLFPVTWISLFSFSWIVLLVLWQRRLGGFFILKKHAKEVPPIKAQKKKSCHFVPQMFHWRTFVIRC